MSDDPATTEQDRLKAAELYAAARRLEARGDYHGARRNYEESLKLDDDESVRRAYFKLLATIGPL